jgi:hypothetical protein
MPIATHTFRVFVSSTFEDLKTERYGWCPLPARIDAGEFKMVCEWVAEAVES